MQVSLNVGSQVHAMKYHLVRHAQTDANSQGKLSCENSEGLNEEGRRQSVLLSEYLLTQRFDEVWISPIPRAMSTVEPYLKTSGTEYQLMPVLAEGCYNINPDAAISAPVYGDDGLPPPGEPLGNFRGRVRDFIDTLLGRDESGSVLIVTHGQFIREFLNMFLGASRYVRWPVGNCSETLVEIGADIFIRHVNRNVIQPDARADALTRATQL